MCLGAQARAANEAARRNYEYQLDKRERDWMQTLSITNLERIQYKQGIDASNLGLANVYSEIQEKHGELIDQAFQQNEAEWKEFLQNNTGTKLAASGRTGRSADRIAALDLGNYLAKGSRRAYKLTQAGRKLSEQGAKAAAQTRSEQMQMFANNNVIKNPDLAPPKPVYQNVGMASFMDALSIASSIATIATGVGSIKSAFPGLGKGSFINTAPIGQGAGPMASDRRLKENIKKIGESISGLGVYKFNYIGKAKQYIGAMADEVIKVVPEAAILADDGFYRVNYNLIDVDFREVANG